MDRYYSVYHSRAGGPPNKNVEKLNAYEAMTDQAEIARAAVEEREAWLRCIAVVKLDDPDLLAKIARDDEEFCASAALKKISDQKALADVATNSSRQYIAQEALEKITDQSVLPGIALNAKRVLARLLAAKRLEDKALAREVFLNIALWIKDNNELDILEAKLQAMELLAEYPLEEEELAYIVRYCGEEMKKKYNGDTCKQAAKALHALYRNYKREDIRAYNGTFLYSKWMGRGEPKDRNFFYKVYFDTEKKMKF